MSDISWADGLKIIGMAQQSLGAQPSQGQPMPVPKHGPHNPVLSDEDAATLHLVWSILGIDGSTVGKGSVVPSPTAEPTALSPTISE